MLWGTPDAQFQIGFCEHIAAEDQRAKRMHLNSLMVRRHFRSSAFNRTERS
jgi:hypothetical protein